jgi:hypothetical protein
MTTTTPTPKPRIAIAFPADPQALANTLVENTRLSAVAEALSSAGADVISAPFCDDIADTFATRLMGVDSVLVWFNPFEGGRDRSRLNAALRNAAAKGVRVSAHPDVIDVLGTKDVLYHTRFLAWGSDVKRYASAKEMREGLIDSLKGGVRVLKQMRGQSGDGIWRVALKEEAEKGGKERLLVVQHAVRGSLPQTMAVDDFSNLCRPYFEHSGAMIDQAFQPRLAEGMIRCYMVGNRVAGFGEQLVNALLPGSTPGPRLYFPADRADFQPLKRLLEQEWIAQMCETLGLKEGDLPVLWDADFLLGAKASNGDDTYVLCEINISSVYPFPPSAMSPLVAEAVGRSMASASVLQSPHDRIFKS